MGYLRHPYEWVVVEILSQISNKIAYFSQFIVLLLFGGLYIHEIHNQITFQLYHRYLVGQQIIIPLQSINYHHRLNENTQIYGLSTRRRRTINHVDNDTPWSNIRIHLQLRYSSHHNDYSTVNHINNQQHGLYDIQFESNDDDIDINDSDDIDDEEMNPSNVDHETDGNPFLVRPAMPGNNMQHWYDLYNANAENDNQQDINDIDIDIDDDTDENMDEQDDGSTSTSIQSSFRFRLNRLNRLRR